MPTTSSKNPSAASSAEFKTDCHSFVGSVQPASVTLIDFSSILKHCLTYSLTQISSVATRPRKRRNRQHYCPSRTSPVSCSRWLARYSPTYSKNQRLAPSLALRAPGHCSDNSRLRSFAASSAMTRATARNGYRTFIPSLPSISSSRAQIDLDHARHLNRSCEFGREVRPDTCRE